MKLNGKIITTPYENRTRCDGFWRAEVAKTWASTGEAPTDRRMAEDEWIVGYRDYLLQTRGGANDIGVSPSLELYGTAMGWYGGSDIEDEKFRIEPLLLTNVGYDVIAEDMGDDLDPKIVEAYEKLFFNIRNDEGDVSTSCYKRTFFAQPVGFGVDGKTPEDILWKVIANQFGYRMLVNHWGWTGAHGPAEGEDYTIKEIARMLQVAMQTRILRGEINNFDLTSILGQYIQWERLQRETGQDAGGGANTEQATTLRILQMYKPKLLSAASSVDQQQKILDALNVKMNSDKNISSQVVNDMGPEEGIKVLEEKMQQHFKAEEQVRG